MRKFSGHHIRMISNVGYHEPIANDGIISKYELIREIANSGGGIDTIVAKTGMAGNIIRLVVALCYPNLRYKIEANTLLARKKPRRAKPRKFDYEEACKLYNSGYSPENCADLLGVSPAAIYRVLNLHSVQRRPSKTARLGLDGINARLNMIQKIADLGLTSSHAALAITEKEGKPITVHRLMHWVDYHTDGELAASLKANRIRKAKAQP